VDFEVIALDMGGGLDDPIIVVGLAVCSLVLAMLMVRSWRSGKPLRRRLFKIALFVLLGVLFSPGFARILCIAWVRMNLAIRSQKQPQSIGFILTTPRLVAPGAALVIATLFEAASASRRRPRASV